MHAAVRFAGQLGQLPCALQLVLHVDAAQLLLGQSRAGQAVDVAADGGQDVLAGHVQHGQGLDVDELDVVLQHDLVPGLQLGAVEHLMPGEELHVLLRQQAGHAVRRGAQVHQAPLFRLLHPCALVAVAVEDDALVGDDRLLDQRVQGALEVLRRLQAVGKEAQLLRHGGVDDGVGVRDGGRGAQHAELELVAREGKRRGAVAVGGVLGEARQRVHAHLQNLLLVAAVGRIGLDGGENLGQLRAQVHRYDGRRGLVAAQAVVVARRGHGHAQQILILVHGLDHRAEEQQELGVLIGRFAGLKQVHAGVGGQRPVVVLAAAVDAGEGLFVQQAHHAVLAGDLLHQLHGDLVVIGGDVGDGEDGRELVLGGGGLVVLGLGKDAQLPQFLVQLGHEGLHTGLDRAEVVVVQLLSLGRLRAEEGAAGVDQVGAAVVHLRVDQEILLLRAHGGAHVGHVGVAEELQNAQGLAVDGLHGAQQRGLVVQRFAAVGAERRGDAQHAVLDEGVAVGVPGGVAPGLKGGAQAARGEAGRVRLALNQLLAGKLHDDLAVGGGGDEAVVLLGGDAGHGLEPVGVVGRALLQRPVLHGVRHHHGHVAVQMAAVLHGLLQLFVGLLGETGAHDRVVEYIDAEFGGYVHHGFQTLHCACVVHGKAAWGCRKVARRRCRFDQFGFIIRTWGKARQVRAV